MTYMICYACSKLGLHEVILFHKVYFAMVLQWQWVTIRACHALFSSHSWPHARFFHGMYTVFYIQAAVAKNKNIYNIHVILLEMTVRFDCWHLEVFYHLLRPAIFSKKPHLYDSGMAISYSMQT